MKYFVAKLICFLVNNYRRHMFDIAQLIIDFKKVDDKSFDVKLCFYKGEFVYKKTELI